MAGLDAARVYVVPPFVRRLEGLPSEGPACVLFVGRLVAGKGVLEAARGLARLGSGPSAPGRGRRPAAAGS